MLAWLSAVALTAAGTPTNLQGGALEVCSTDPLTGWFRDGYCRTDEADRGVHVVCAQVTSEFLEYSRAQGNDLVTPSPEHRFPGLEPDDRWCLCAARWLEAHRAGKAPPMVPSATHEKARDIIPAEVIEDAGVAEADPEAGS